MKTTAHTYRILNVTEVCQHRGAKKNHLIFRISLYNCVLTIAESLLCHRGIGCTCASFIAAACAGHHSVRFSSCSLHIRINVLHTCLDKVQRKVPIHFYRRITKAQIKPQFIQTPDDLLLQSKYALYIQCTTPLYPFFAVLFHTFLASLWFLFLYSPPWETYHINVFAKQPTTQINKFMKFTWNAVAHTVINFSSPSNTRNEKEKR